MPGGEQLIKTDSSRPSPEGLTLTTVYKVIARRTSPDKADQSLGPSTQRLHVRLTETDTAGEPRLGLHAVAISFGQTGRTDRLDEPDRRANGTERRPDLPLMRPRGFLRGAADTETTLPPAPSNAELVGSRDGNCGHQWRVGDRRVQEPFTIRDRRALKGSSPNSAAPEEPSRMAMRNAVPQRTLSSSAPRSMSTGEERWQDRERAFKNGRGRRGSREDDRVSSSDEGMKRSPPRFMPALGPARRVHSPSRYNDVQPPSTRSTRSMETGAYSPTERGRACFDDRERKSVQSPPQSRPLLRHVPSFRRGAGQATSPPSEEQKSTNTSPRWAEGLRHDRDQRALARIPEQRLITSSSRQRDCSSLDRGRREDPAIRFTRRDGPNRASSQDTQIYSDRRGGASGRFDRQDTGDTRRDVARGLAPERHNSDSILYTYDRASGVLRRMSSDARTVRFDESSIPERDSSRRTSPRLRTTSSDASSGGDSEDGSSSDAGSVRSYIRKRPTVKTTLKEVAASVQPLNRSGIKQVRWDVDEMSVPYRSSPSSSIDAVLGARTRRNGRWPSRNVSDIVKTHEHTKNLKVLLDADGLRQAWSVGKSSKPVRDCTEHQENWGERQSTCFTYELRIWHPTGYSLDRSSALCRLCFVKKYEAQLSTREV